MRTPDIDMAAALLSRGASLEKHCPYDQDTGGRRVHFNLVDVPDVALQEYRTGAQAFSISAFIANRRYLMDIVKSAR